MENIKYKIETLAEEMHGFKYQVKIYTSIDGVNWYYSGNGKFFKSIEAAKSWIITH